MKWTCGVVCLAAAGAVGAAGAAHAAGAAAPLVAECGSDLPAHGRQQVAADGFTVAFVPSVWPIPVGKHFNLVMQICTPTGRAVVNTLKVDADMPLHKHGMNYRASVTPLDDGSYAASGLMLHMPGRWRFVFEIGSEARNTRLQQEIDVP